MTEEQLAETYDYYVKAFTQPSLEYIYAYLRVGTMLAIFALLVWFFCIGDKLKKNEKISFDDF